MKHLKNSFVLLLTLFMLMGSSVCKAETISAIRISTADELKEFRNSVNMRTSGPKMAARNYDTSNKSWSSKINAYVYAYEAYVILDADINLSLNTQWIPIGKNSTYCFNGTFDGNGHTIISPSGFSNTTKENYGIFGYLGGTVKNLTVCDGCTIKDAVENVGLIVAYSYRGTISNCKVRLGIKAPQSKYVGNIVGYAYNSTIENCAMIVGGAISGNNNVGNIAGYITSSTVKNCYAQSCMVEGNENVGGLIGLAEYENTIEGCYMYLGYVDGKKDYIGGLIGCIYGDRNTVTIKNCYSTGTTRINGRTDYQGKRVGEFVGNDDGYTVYENCYHYYSTTERVPLIGRLSSGAENSIIKNCYYNRYFNEDISNVVIGNGEKPNEGSFQGVDESLFKSGALTYKINGNSTSNPIYVQKIGSESTPSLYSSTNKNIVYPHYKHGSNTYDVYSNNSTDYHNTPNSTYNHDNYIVASTGKCSACGAECLPPLVSGYYEISTEKHLKKFAQMVNNGSSNINGLLKRDISLTSAFTPIGNSSKIYTGTFDGAGHTISNLEITANSQYVGLFGYSRGVIRNLTVSGNVTNDFNSTDKGSYTGMIVGSLEGTIENCYASGSVTVSNSTRVGGLVGYAANNFEIKSCGNNATVKGIAAIGGIVGRADLDNDNSLLEKCYNTGTITGTGNNIGGLIGYLKSKDTQRNLSFENCYNTGAIKGESTSQDVGGLVGYLQSKATFTSCYSSATVYGEDGSTGGVIGCISSGITTSATNCYFNSDKNSKAIGLRTLSTGKFTGVTTTVFASGKVAYDLNNGNTTNPIYTQYIDFDNNPVIRKDLVETSIVYAQYKHGSNEIIGYKNKRTITFHSQPNSIEDHDLGTDDLTGKCTICGAYCRPPLVNGCYEISSQRELEQFANMVNKGIGKIDGKLKNNIDITSDFTPIGISSSKPYSGKFDGAGYNIRKLKTTENCQYNGLFGYSTGQICNLTIKDASITCNYTGTGDSYAGIIVGYQKGGRIENCETSGTVTNGNYVGGIAGYSTNSEFTKCINNTSVTSDNDRYIGGLVGYINGGNVKYCYNIKNVKGTNTIGGFVGYDYQTSYQSCYTYGTVTGSKTGATIGAFIGASSGTSTIKNCYYNSDKVQNSVGKGALNSYEITGKSTSEFESGDVTYALNQKATTNPVFTQFLTSFLSDKYYSKEYYPVIRKIRDDKSIVYGFYEHGSSEGIYSNTELSNYHTNPDPKSHDYYILENGICSLCKKQCRPPYESGYYVITKEEHLHALSRMVNQEHMGHNIKVRLMNDISISSNFTPIGTKESPFAGEFEGYDHRVTIKVDTPSQYAGLFGYSKGTIKKLIVEGTVTSTYTGTGDSYAGIIVGYQQGGRIENCESKGAVSNGKNTGGSVGWADGTVFEKCKNTGSVNSNSGNHVGGLIGTSINATINYCYNNKTVNGGTYAGGLVGYDENTTYTSCYSTSFVKGTYTGGMIGSANKSKVTNCYFNSDYSSKAIGVGTIYSGKFTAATEEDFQSGAITYALNDGKTENPVYTQYLTNDYALSKEYSPVIRNSKEIYKYSTVYLYYEHGENSISYTNKTDNFHTSPDCEDNHDHYISANGNCSICNAQIIRVSNGYYEIDNYTMLKKFASLVSNGNANIKAKLTNDIVANKQLLNANGGVTGVLTEIWTPINNFKGEFDGQGHTISGLYVDNKGNAGLFENLIGATIKNVHIVDSYFKGATVGAICVTAQSGTKINRCSNQSTVEGTNAAAICHNAMSVSISYCYNTGAKVPLVGVSLQKGDCIIDNCYNAKYGKEETNVTYTNSYYLADEYATDGGCTESQFNNGVVCWLLNGKKETNDVIWRQNQGDKYPSFEGAIVTKASMHCDHVYGSDFKCLICGDRKQLEVEGGFCLIHNFDDLTLFALKVTEDKETSIKAKLTDNIVANKQLLNANGEVKGVPAKTWTPIKGFGGEFDGQGHTISGLYANDTKENLGLFDNLNGATIKNVHIVDSYFNGASAGAICASADGRTKIYRCSNQSTVKGTGIIGAICGIPMNVSISYCYNTGANVPLVGTSLDKDACTIENCYNTKPYKEKGYLTYTNSYYLADEYTTDGGCTESQFANGEVCWLLNGKKETSDVIWRQNPGDKYPSFEGAVVKGSEKKYNELHLSDEECDFANGKSYETVTYTRKVNSDAHSAHWGTVCLPFSFNESNCAGGVKFYEVTNVTENGIELNQITHVEAGQAVLFYNAGDWSVSVGGPVVIRNTVNEGDPMIGTYQQKAVEVGSNNYFYVKENKFYKGNTSFNVPAFHAYLEGTGVNSLSSFSIVRDNVMEEAEEEETAEAKTISAIYTANGQRVSEMNGKGVYIVVFSDGTSKKVHIVE